MGYRALSSSLACLFILLLSQTSGYTTLDWTSYKGRYSKTYNNTEDPIREANYNAALAELRSIEQQITTNGLLYTVDINQYSDWSADELRVLMNGARQKSNPRGDSFSDYKTGRVSRRRLAPSSIDWKGQSGSVKSQGKDCASSWAFAVTAMCEASVTLKEADTHNFAEQYLVECTSYSNCNGGYIEYALEKIINSNGLPDESEFPYDPTASYSRICKGGSSLTFVAQYFYRFYGLSDSQMIDLLQNGPVAVSVSSDGWQHYKSGVYECPQNPTLTHAALLVGYTSSYWVLKNSWGIGWGNSGYIRVTRTRSKNCGIGRAVFALSEYWLHPLSLMILAFFLLLALLI